MLAVVCASSENTGDQSLLAALVWCVILLRIPVRSGSLVGELPFEPVLSEEFDRMLRPNRSVSAAEVIGGAVLVASPADSFWMLRIDRYFRS